MQRLAAVARPHLQVGLVVQQVVALGPSGGGSMCRPGREGVHRRDAALDEALALVAPCARDEAEVIVGDQPLTALVSERADRAVGDGLGVGGDGGRGDHGLEPPGHAAVQRGVAREVDASRSRRCRGRRARSAGRALDLGEHPVVEAQLVHDAGLDLPGELGVQHLVGVSAELRRCSMRRRKSARPCQRPSKNCAW